MSRVVVFDLDGTLVDTPRGIVASFTAAFHAMGLAAPDPAAIRGTIGVPLESALGQLLAVAPDHPTVAQAIRHYQASFKEQVLPRAGELLYPGVASGLATLRRRGFELAVATSKWYASADALLSAAELRSYFAVVVGADQVSRPKPDPEMARVIMRHFGTSPHHVLMVGDSTHDVLMAKAAGMRSIAVTYGVHSAEQLGSAGPTWLVDTFDGVLKHIEMLEPDLVPPTTQ